MFVLVYTKPRIYYTEPSMWFLHLSTGQYNQ